MTLLRDQRRRIIQLLIAVAWYASLSGVVAALTQSPFAIVFVALSALGLATGALAASLAATWTARARGRVGQFGIGFLLLFIFYVAALLGAVRWLLAAMAQVRGDPAAAPDPAWYFGAVGAAGIVALASLPVTTGLLDSLTWMGVWLVRRPWIVRRLAHRRASPASPGCSANEPRPGSQ